MKKKPRILVVDDHPIHRGLLADELSDLDYEVERARNAAEADGKLRGFEPDLLVTDLVIQGDRFEIIRWVQELRKEKTYEALPILFVTAYGEDMRQYVNEFDHSDLLLKPFDYEEVLQKVRKLLP